MSCTEKFFTTATSSAPTETFTTFSTLWFFCLVFVAIASIHSAPKVAILNSLVQTSRIGHQTIFRTIHDLSKYLSDAKTMMIVILTMTMTRIGELKYPHSILTFSFGNVVLPVEPRVILLPCQPSSWLFLLLAHIQAFHPIPRVSARPLGYFCSQACCRRCNLPCSMSS